MHEDAEISGDGGALGRRGPAFLHGDAVGHTAGSALRIRGPSSLHEVAGDEASDEGRGPSEIDARVGTPIDLLRGGVRHDIRTRADRLLVQDLVQRSTFTAIAPECKTFSRARGRPVPGARCWPMA